MHEKTCIDLLYLRHVLVTTVVEMADGQKLQILSHTMAATDANFSTRLQQWPTGELPSMRFHTVTLIVMIIEPEMTPLKAAIFDLLTRSQSS